MKARRGALRAAVAIGHKILVFAHHILTKGGPYNELGEAYLDQKDQSRTADNLVRRLERLGFKVTIETQPQPQPA